MVNRPIPPINRSNPKRQVGQARGNTSLPQPGDKPAKGTNPTSDAGPLSPGKVAPTCGRRAERHVNLTGRKLLPHGLAAGWIKVIQRPTREKTARTNAAPGVPVKLTGQPENV